MFQDGEPAADTLWRNPDLKPQVSRWMEALWETLPQPGWRVNTGVFAIQIENAPVLVDTPTLNGLDCMRAACNQYRNAADSLYVVGVESGLRISNPGGVLAYASLSLQGARQGSEELTASPDYVLKAGIASPILGRLLNVSADASYVGGTPGWIDGPGLRSAGTSPYLLLNLGLHRSFSRARISLRASNLLDKNIFTIASRELTPLARVPLDGRNFSLQVSLDF
ncbi:MAG: TonB-dependent receptor [Burkholderiales bacterium]|nr:TonB-dependent receptor [Burkholderiales bacterium]